jgi:hypothetical protein
MVNQYKRLLAAGGAAAAATVIAVSGFTAASASPAASPRVHGTEHLSLMNTSDTATHESFIMTGLVTAGGVDIPSTSHSGADLIKVPGGTFKIAHQTGKVKQSFNPRTCLFSINETGPFEFKAGTGKFAGIRGGGKYHLNILAVAARDSHGKCAQSKAPLAFQQTINATGQMSLP